MPEQTGNWAWRADRARGRPVDRRRTKHSQWERLGGGGRDKSSSGTAGNYARFQWVEGISLEPGWTWARHFARSGPGVANHTYFFHPAGPSGYVGRHTS